IRQRFNKWPQPFVRGLGYRRVNQPRNLPARLNPFHLCRQSTRNGRCFRGVEVLGRGGLRKESRGKRALLSGSTQSAAKKISQDHGGCGWIGLSLADLAVSGRRNHARPGISPLNAERRLERRPCEKRKELRFNSGYRGIL